MEIDVAFEEHCGYTYFNHKTSDYKSCDNGLLYRNGEKISTCSRCHGSGYEPTQLGEDLLKFLEHQGFMRQAK